jgi:hypothetical protein
MIEIIKHPADEDAQSVFAAGKGFQGYYGYIGLTEEAHKRFGPCDVWYTERNGDSIGMFVPVGTPESELPDVAMLYCALEWIKPEDDFGSGVMVHGQNP